jgi:hypothetical protein
LDLNPTGGHFGDGEGASVFFTLFLIGTFFLTTAFLVAVALGVGVAVALAVALVVGVAVALAVGDGVLVAASALDGIKSAAITSTAKDLITIPLKFAHGKEDTNN